MLLSDFDLELQTFNIIALCQDIPVTGKLALAVEIAVKYAQSSCTV